MTHPGLPDTFDGMRANLNRLVSMVLVASVLGAVGARGQGEPTLEPSVLEEPVTVTIDNP